MSLNEESLKDNSKLLLCPDCDEIYEFALLTDKQKAKCGRCGHIMYRGYSTLGRVKILTIAGLLLYYPAMFLPILKVHMAGTDLETSSFQTIYAFTTQQYWPIAIVVTLFAIIIPIARLLIYATIIFDNRYLNKYLGRPLIKFLKPTLEWAMIDVYFMGIIVTISKMLDQSEVQLTIGTLSLLLLMINNVLLQSSTHYDELWRRLYERD